MTPERLSEIKSHLLAALEAAEAQMTTASIYMEEHPAWDEFLDVLGETRAAIAAAKGDK